MSWACGACTLMNAKPYALACMACGTERAAKGSVSTKWPAVARPEGDGVIVVCDDDCGDIAGAAGAFATVSHTASIGMLIPCDIPGCGARVEADKYDEHCALHALALASPVPRATGAHSGGTREGVHGRLARADDARGPGRPVVRTERGHGIAADDAAVVVRAIHKAETRPPGTGFVPLLRAALVSRPLRGREVALCENSVLHYSQAGTIEDGAGWACGYRNLQMMCSALLTHRKWACRLFHGAGAVPDVESLQLWIERAWAAGFDREGAGHFGGRLAGSRAWIGATDCAAMLRYFGIPALVVDFVVPGRRSTGASRGACFRCGELGHWARECKTRLDGDRVLPKSGGPSAAGAKRKFEYTGAVQHDKLVEWTWNYFTTGVAAFPLLLQHDGHSRTIIGVERRCKDAAMAVDVGQRTIEEVLGSSRTVPVRETLLYVLDPGSNSVTLGQALERGTGWQRSITRSLDTLKQPEYQVVYIPHDAEPLCGAEYERAKILSSERLT